MQVGRTTVDVEDLASRTVVGIDVGGTKKGFHAVALRGGNCIVHQAGDPQELLDFCRAHEAAAIAVDSPCGWRQGKARRSSERALSKERISSYATPHPSKAESDFYLWMHNGFRLYSHFRTAGIRLFEGIRRDGENYIFETFPHAVERAYCDMATAKEKKTFRRLLLENSGVDVSCLTSVDFIDAALCALTARYFLTGKFKVYGDDPLEGLIVVPAVEKRARSSWSGPKTSASP